jgi:hypothetical protein
MCAKSVVQEEEEVEGENNSFVGNTEVFGHSHMKEFMYAKRGNAIAFGPYHTEELKCANVPKMLTCQENNDGSQTEVSAVKTNAVDKPSLQSRRRASATEKKVALKEEEDVKSEAVPFAGKTVAFGCNTTCSSFLISQLGEKFDEKGFCYDLDNTVGHIVGTVLCRNKMVKRKKQVTMI